jgi:hypothetical protein
MAKFKVQVQETNSYYVILEAKSKEDLIDNFDNLIFNKDLNKAELFDSDGGILINEDQIKEEQDDQGAYEDAMESQANANTIWGDAEDDNYDGDK